MDGFDVPGLHGLIQRLPLQLVLFDNRTASGFANDRFTDEFGLEQLESPDLHRLARDAGGAWQPVTLRRRDGRDVVTCAQAIAVSDGVLLVFGEAGGPDSIPENARLRERITELEGLCATDGLTGAWNRVQLERMVDVEISRTARSGQPATLILLDIDHFKRVNDDHGHLTGDAVLMEFVGRIRERTRNTDSLFRWGGDEFVLLATSVGYRGGAALGEALRRIVAAEPFDKVGPITASLGVTEYMEGESAASWFQRTDRALYAAKAAGRNRMYVDRQGNSDLHADRVGAGLLRLYWLEAYECGNETIDSEHRELFRLGNMLIGAVIEKQAAPESWRAALDAALSHLAQHFDNEETLLARHRYPQLAEHRQAHAHLLKRAGELKAAVEAGASTLSHLVNFLVNDVIALHILKMDRDFYPLLASGDGGSPDRARR